MAVGVETPSLISIGTLLDSSPCPALASRALSDVCNHLDRLFLRVLYSSSMPVYSSSEPAHTLTFGIFLVYSWLFIDQISIIPDEWPLASPLGVTDLPAVQVMRTLP